MRSDYVTWFLGLLLVGSSSNALHAQYSAVPDTSDFMNKDPFNLEQVVVTATRTQKKIKDIPVITQVLTAKQIEARGINDVKDLLMQEVPGLNFQEVGFGTSIDIQGLSSQHVLFLIDGERIAGENGGNIDYTRINLYNIDRIEIVKGASSALYGSQAMGGVINVITKQAKKKVEASVGARYAGMNQRNYEDTPKDHSQYKFRRNVDKQNINANASIGFNLGKLTMNTDVLYKSFDGYQLYDRKPLTKYFAAYDTTVVEAISKTPTSISGYEDLNISHRMSYRFSPKLTVSVKGGYYMLNKYDFEANNIFDNTEDYNYGGNIDYKINETSHLTASYYADYYSRYDKFEKKSGRRLEYKNNIQQPRVMYTNTALKNQTLTGGLEFYRESLYGDKFSNEENETKSQWYGTFFAQDDWKIDRRFSAIAGIRADYHQEYGLNVTPKISFMYKPFPFTLRLNYARGYRSPTLKELFMDWDHLGMFWIYGNPDLKPETNNYISLSGEYINNWLNVTANLYGNWFRNKIEGEWTNDQTELHYVNVGHSRLMGAEVVGKIRFNNHFSMHGAYNYLYTAKDKQGVRLSSSSPHSGNVRLEYNLTKNKYATIINVNGSIMGKKEFDVLDELEVNGETVEAYYKAKVNMYSLWEVTASQYLFKGIRLTVGVTNLFDYHADRISFNTSTSPGRKFFVACNLSIDQLIDNLKK